MATADALPSPGRCELAYSAFGSLKVVVGVRPMDPQHTDATKIRVVENAVTELAAHDKSLLQLAGSSNAPDAWLLVDGDDVYLRRAYEAATDPSTVSADSNAQHPADAFGPFTADASEKSKFAQALMAMAKAFNVRRLATSSRDMKIGDQYNPTATLEVVVDQLDPETKKYKPVDLSKPLEVFKGDEMRVRIFNRSGAARGREHPLRWKHVRHSQLFSID